MKEMDQTEYAYKNGYQKGYEEAQKQTFMEYYEIGRKETLKQIAEKLKSGLKAPDRGSDFEWGTKYGYSKVLNMIYEMEKSPCDFDKHMEMMTKAMEEAKK